ncbi:hypothetical protein RclHR1_22990001 [Rhizophagus clarus]|uniref:F-box domain-containing protein n=1 Tax=Rhizophagus clarus TaxID=94130 RepID=A0A2Z6QZS7_9GLOM|nr:hypothetical protein RclHR1_22990001 [Rhizophagus clarus]GET00606.1 hypothetical protein GLOIN_2v1481084 [Rhizophagus clarus]
MEEDPASLHSCILVNITWCKIAIPILWKYMSYVCTKNHFNYEEESRKKLYNIIFHFLSHDSKDLLSRNNIILPLNELPGELLFNYMNYFTHINPFWIEDMTQLMINRNNVERKKKLKLLKDEIFKLIFSKCTNVKYFCLNSELELCTYENAVPFLSNISSLNVDFIKSRTTYTFKILSNICQNIKELEIKDCNVDCKYLASLIKNQKNLQSLYLCFDNTEDKYNLLNYGIVKKSHTIIKFTLQPLLNFPPKFLLKLRNLTELNIHNEYYDYLNENTVNWKNWEDFLTMASFPVLTRLKTSYLPCKIESLIIANSGGGILEIESRHSLDSYCPTNSKILIASISTHCLKLIELTMDINSINVSELAAELAAIFSNCTQLEKIYFTSKVKTLPNGDELLRIMSNSSLENLKDFSFNDKWNFSLEGLGKFLKSWRSKKKPPIRFTHYYDGMTYRWTTDHEELVENYESN